MLFPFLYIKFYVYNLYVCRWHICNHVSYHYAPILRQFQVCNISIVLSQCGEETGV